MQIEQLQLKHFRCFDNYTLDLSAPLVLLEGMNGTGKTSLLEAMHYLCYLRSFRTHTPRELAQFDAASFFVKAAIRLRDESHDVQVGFSGKKRLVKVDKKSVGTFKDIMDYYRVVTITEDDLQLVKGSPEVRRSFLDQALILDDPTCVQQLKTYRSIVENRNALLARGTSSGESFELWTRQLWDATIAIQHARCELLADLATRTNKLAATQGSEVTIHLAYAPKRVMHDTFEEFWQHEVPRLQNQEARFGRSLFGAHLDDMAITFADRSSRLYASRGQQKLIMLLIKLAQLQRLAASQGPAVFLLDDFMTDFDGERIDRLMPLLTDLEGQLIITSPANTGFFEAQVLARGAQHIHLY